MSDKTLRGLIAISIAALIIHQAGLIITGMFGLAWGLVTALTVAIVSFYSGHMARASGKGSVWYLLPTLLFTIIPIGWMIFRSMNTETDIWDRLWSLSSFFIGFVLPVLLLSFVYYELRKRYKHKPLEQTPHD